MTTTERVGESVDRVGLTYDTTTDEEVLPPSRWWTVLEVLALLALPVVLFYVLAVEPFFRQNGVDPFIYVGYMENLTDLIDRYGYPYYAVRFGLILPGRLFISFLGPVAGHFALRYVLALVAAGPVYLLGRRWGSRAAAWFGAILTLSSPVFLRALMTTYSDTTGLPFLLGGLACLLMPSSRRPAWAAASGVLFGLAIHSNPFLVALVAGVLTARFVLQLLRGEWRSIVDYLIAGAGVVAVTLAGMAYYGIVFGDADIIRPTVRASRLLTGSMVDIFRQPDLDWVGFSPHLFLPVVALAVGLGVMFTRRRAPDEGRWRALIQEPVADVLVLLLAAAALYLHQEFVGGRYVLVTYYYASYLLAFTVLVLTAALAELGQRSTFASRAVWVAAGLLVAVPVARNLSFDGLQLWVWPWVPILVGAVLVAFVLGRWKPSALAVGPSVAAVALVLLAVAPPRGLPIREGISYRQDPLYHLAIGNASTDWLDRYQLSIELIEAMPTWEQEPGNLVFWYPRSGLIDSMQSTYLWGGTTINAYLPGMPELNDRQKALLVDRPPRHLVLLAQQPEDIVAGRRALDAVGMDPIEVLARELDVGDDTIYVEQLTFAADPCQRERPKANPVLASWLEQGPCPVPPEA